MLLINVNVPENERARAKFTSVNGDAKYICMVRIIIYSKRANSRSRTTITAARGRVYSFSVGQRYTSADTIYIKWKSLYFPFVVFYSNRIQMIKRFGKMRFQFKRVHRHLSMNYTRIPILRSCNGEICSVT